MNTLRFIPYILTLIGLAAAAYALQLGLWEYGEPGAGLFPLIAALLLVGSSLLSTSDVIPSGSKIEYPRLVSYVFALFVFGLSLELTGFAFAAAFFLTWVFALIERIEWKRALSFACIFAFAIWGLFNQVLALPLPSGRWGF